MTTLHVHPHFNPEEAAHAAAEYLANLDNLQAEIQFLTDEIKEKDIRITTLLQRINSRHTGLTRQLKNPTASTATFPLPIPPGAPLPTEHLSAKDATALTKIQAEWGKIDALQDEKVALAERMERIINRAKERGKAEWLRVGGMDLDALESEASAIKPGALGEMGNGDIMLPPGGLGSGSDMRPQKKRKLQTLPLPLPTSAVPAGMIVHPPSSMPPPSAPLRPQLSARHSAAHRSGRHERHLSGLSDFDMDAHGEAEETEQADGETDDTLYCFCRQKSYGEMIGCDNEKCEFEWFHVKCVNLNGALPETWYCPDCVTKLGLASSDGTRLSQKDKKNRRR